MSIYRGQYQSELTRTVFAAIYSADFNQFAFRCNIKTALFYPAKIVQKSVLHCACFFLGGGGANLFFLSYACIIILFPKRTR